MQNPELLTVHYRCRVNLNLYDSPALERLATQAAVGRYLRFGALGTYPVSESQSDTSAGAVDVCLSEDDYPGWLARHDLQHLEQVEVPYQPIAWSAAEIQARIPGAIAFAQTAMTQPNHYLWGGTVAPNYDCSGLVQAAFASLGIWLPRDAYQQEAFTHAIARSELRLGDLIFFGPAHKATHVGLYLGDNHYIHSSGKDQGHNGIAIDVLSEDGSPVSQRYYNQLRGAGRIVAAYQPKGLGILDSRF
ncbi:MAG: C40 family peptidase [Leptolyngbyaceae cyanobacterium RU_5_1]|nr:C40 family peptidase [Leptolyngbyaceae cyanobacterium RU_5_1]